MASEKDTRKSVTYSRSKNRRQEKAAERRKQFTPRKRTSESEDDGVCDLCVQTIKIYAIGHCDHPICYRCSAKMRILCDQNHCAVCRIEMKKVIYSKSKREFNEANTLRLLNHRKHNVWFTDEIVKKEYEKLFEHHCPVCPDHPSNTSFEQLQEHLRKDHKLFYCSLCIQHNTNFTDECKTYTRESLAKHRRVGDDNDTSHKGHPLCEFCDERFLDNDMLLQHLRKDHYFCHFCDQEGRNQYYDGYVDLRDHYRKEHFLCEEGDCINEEFTSVFATELDLKAHRAAAHNQTMSRQQQKVERTIDLGFQYSNPPARGGRGGATRGRGRGRGAGRSEGLRKDEDLERAIALSLSEQENGKKAEEKSRGDRPRLQREEKPKKRPEPEEPPPPDLVNDFPTLGSSKKNEQKDPFAYTSIHKQPPKSAEEPVPQEKPLSAPTAAAKIAVAMGRSVGKISQEDFPTLGSNSKQGTSQPTGLWGATAPPVTSKPTTAKVQKPVSVNIPQSKYSKASVDVANKEEFPTLGGGSSNSRSLLATTWCQPVSVTSTTSKKQKKPKTPLAASQEVVKKKTPTTKSTPTVHQSRPTPKPAPPVVHNNSQVTHDDTVSIRIGSHKHTMRLTSQKYSDQIQDIEKPVEVPGVGGTSVKTVSAGTFSLLSSSADSSNKPVSKSGPSFGQNLGDFPELGSGQKGRIKGIGPTKTSSGTPWGQGGTAKTETTKKSKFSLSDLGRDIAADIETFPGTNSASNFEGNSDFRPCEDDFPAVTRAPPLSSYSATWHDEPTLSVADTVVKETSFQSRDDDFPSLLGNNAKASQNIGRKNKKKKKNKGQPNLADISKHFGATSIQDSETEEGHLQRLIQSQEGKDHKSLSSLLDKDGVFAPVQNGELKLQTDHSKEIQSKPAAKKKLLQEDQNPLDPRPDEDDIHGRNMWLINTIQQLCGNEDNFSEFKSASGGFRQGTLTANRYYEKCRVLLGRKHFDEVFRELVALLPDSDKQEALLQVHESW